MATPRKSWFRVADSILREPWPRDAKLTLVLLCAWLNQRWARDGLSAEEATRAVLTRAALHDITGRSQLAHGVSALRVLGQCVTISISVRGELVEIHFPKFAEFQRLASESRENPGKKLPPPPPPPPTPTDEERKTDAEPSRSPWLNLLAKERGSVADKAAFLERELPVIEAEAEAAHPRDRKAQGAKMRSLILRFWRQRLRNPAGPPAKNGRPQPLAPRRPDAWKPRPAQPVPVLSEAEAAAMLRRLEEADDVP